MHTSMPAEFFLPPATEAELWRETAASTLDCYVFIFMLGIVVALPQGIVVRV